MYESDRITPAILKQRAALVAGVRVDTGEPLPPDIDLAAFERRLDNTLADHFAYQTIQSHAHAAGRITTEEALVVYTALGEVPAADGWAPGTDLATKVIVTNFLGSLVGIR
jgi:hypothetical protein